MRVCLSEYLYTYLPMLVGEGVSVGLSIYVSMNELCLQLFTKNTLRYLGMFLFPFSFFSTNKLYIKKIDFR